MSYRVFVGLSGGVDSATSAALLQQKGFDVVGVFIKIWRPEFIECTWKEDRIDAMRVCAALKIPFLEVDLSTDYKKQVVDTMIADYSRGSTPNPDVLCNRAIKFGSFLSWARTQGADYIATGHYARIRQSGGHFDLLRGTDAEKDQSYFLHQLGQQELARTVFPVGGMKKNDVRAKAKTFNLPVATKHDSQGLCFVGDVSMSDFLRRFIRVESGPVLDMQGKTIGEHEGAALYTVGERHGFQITNAEAATLPHYVVRIDTLANTLTVSTKRSDAASDRALIADLRWVHRPLADGSDVEAQARYREKPFLVRVRRERDALSIQSNEPRLFPPGQSLVLYDGDICLGGGVIQTAAPRTPRDSTFSPAAPVRKRA